MNHNIPQAVPQSAQDFLHQASETLGERGKQYDPAGKQERSMTAIVQAFNAIYPHNLLTVHMGWQFMSLVKMVRGATKPHADSALDQVAYAALAAECVAECLHQPVPTKQPAEEPTKYYVVLSQPELYDAQKEFIMEQVLAGHKVQIMSDATARKLHLEEELEEEPKLTAGKRVEQLLSANQALAEELGKCQHWAGVQSQELKHLEAKARAAHEAYMQALEHNRSLEVQLDTTHSALADFVCRFDLTKEYMTKEQVLAGQAKHEAQVEKLRERECLDIETINDLRTELASCKAITAKFQAERKANKAMHEEVTRLRNKVQDLADLAEYRDKRNAELCAELESQRGKCVAQSARLGEFSRLIENLRAELARVTKEANSACAELSRAQDEIQSLLAEKRHLTARNKELEDKVQSLNNEVEAKVRELMSSMKPKPVNEYAVAHNTDEKVDALRAAITNTSPAKHPYVDPFDSHGGQQPLPRTVGSADPAHAPAQSSGLSTAPSFGMSSGSELAYPAGKPL